MRGFAQSTLTDRLGQRHRRCTLSSLDVHASPSGVPDSYLALKRLLTELQLEMAQLASAPHTIATPQSGNIGGIIARPFEPLEPIESHRATSLRLSMPIIPHMRASRHFGTHCSKPSAKTALFPSRRKGSLHWATARNSYVTNSLPGGCRLERRGPAAGKPRIKAAQKEDAKRCSTVSDISDFQLADWRGPGSS
jgi:hypothetical protein